MRRMVVTLALVLVVAGCAPGLQLLPHQSTSAPPSVAAPETALAQLQDLAVRGRAPLTGYDRDLFAWRSDTDRNGCDTRNDVLRRDLTHITLRPNGCVVLTGDLTSPYTGETFAFTRGEHNNIDIDHVVALGNAWQTGAQAWDDAERARFGNDPLNLLAVESEVNQRKSAGDAATWLPPYRPGRCAYVARQVAVKHRYGLWVTPSERDAIERILTACPDEPAPVADPWPPTDPAN